MTEQTSQIPLSFNQTFLCAFDRGAEHGAFGDKHTLSFGCRLSGEVDVDALQGALNDVAERHEALRTEIVRSDPENQHQLVHAPGPVPLVVSDFPADDPRPRDEQAEAFLNELEAGSYSVEQFPLVWGFLGRFDESESVLVVTVHHTATDSWSMEIIMRDLAEFYTARRGLGEANLPELHGFPEFTAYQLESAGSEPTQHALEHWKTKLAGAQILAVKTDRPFDENVTNEYSAYRYRFDAELTETMLKFATANRSTAFMVLMAAYNVLLHKRTGATDIVVPTFTSGRGDERFMATVGPIFNYLLLRTDLSGCASFREVLAKTRTTCFDAYTNDIPFALVANQSPEVLAPFQDPTLAVIAFEVLQTPADITDDLIGDLKYTEIRRRLLPHPLSSHIPNGALWATDVLPSGEMVGSLKFDLNRFDEATVIGLVDGLRETLRNAVTNPDAPIANL
ncbi:Condensation domain-containing protein [Actinokineospora alba]|uniref:Condensation domain-containing protein n=1 Tax=Actinokineospora alba TaxID=504798 RepID=A0A1H0HCQ5_9PSEU|nr:condensation domain-containing protein [Actinokineospora alba]TDP64938.1 condensation domain-containing protein [Actinokineospora alba]SDH49825.1 Condensation domain-containing protein [Actinokineospora alba]SDO16935.1 Condensation domain-containing protein [Actinokineospora alba]